MSRKSLLKQLTVELPVLKNNHGETEEPKIPKKLLLAKKIALELKRKEITYSQFADIMGKRPSEITRWMSGTHNFTLDTLSCIEEKLQIRLLDLAHNEEIVFQSTKRIFKTPKGLYYLQNLADKSL